MKKSLKALRRIVSILLLLITIVMVISTIVSTFLVGKADKSILGYKAFVVLSDSMMDTFAAGDVIICKEVDPSTLKAGDIITFKSTNVESFGEIVTHKIRECILTEYNQEAFITYGTTTNTNDSNPVLYSKVIGKYQSKIPKVGSFFEFLKTPSGYIFFILIPFLILIALQVQSSIILYKRFRRERAAEATEEQTTQETLEATRIQTEALMEEIRLLKEQMNASTNLTKNKEENTTKNE